MRAAYVLSPISDPPSPPPSLSHTQYHKHKKGREREVTVIRSTARTKKEEAMDSPAQRRLKAIQDHLVSSPNIDRHQLMLRANETAGEFALGTKIS